MPKKRASRAKDRSKGSSSGDHPNARPLNDNGVSHGAHVDEDVDRKRATMLNDARAEAARQRMAEKAQCYDELIEAVDARVPGLAADALMKVLITDLSKVRYMANRFERATEQTFLKRDKTPHPTTLKFLDVLERLTDQWWRLIDRVVEASPAHDEQITVEIVEVDGGPA